MLLTHNVRKGRRVPLAIQCGVGMPKPLSCLCDIKYGLQTQDENGIVLLLRLAMWFIWIMCGSAGLMLYIVYAMDKTIQSL